MLRNFCFYTFIVALLFISCDTRDSKCLVANIEIDSEELKSAILEYDSIIRHNPKFLAETPDGNYLLTVYERNINDSVTNYAISFSFDTWFMQGEPVWLAYVGGKLVVFYPSGNYHGILSTDKQLHKEIARRYFPAEYKLLAKGKPLDCVTLNDSPSLVLTFYKGKLVAKKLSMGI